MIKEWQENRETKKRSERFRVERKVEDQKDNVNEIRAYFLLNGVTHVACHVTPLALLGNVVHSISRTVACCMSHGCEPIYQLTYVLHCEASFFFLFFS